MARNIVFYFSGTGNSLHLAKVLASSMTDVALYSMGNTEVPHIGVDVESIGFVFPMYFRALPAAVHRFANQLRGQELCGKYLYAINTSGGGKPFNTLCDLNDILNTKGLSLNYGASLAMYGNYVPMFDMQLNVPAITAKSNEAMKPIIADIVARRENKISKPFFLVHMVLSVFSRSFLSSVAHRDEGFSVSDTCTGCGTC